MKKKLLVVSLIISGLLTGCSDFPFLEEKSDVNVTSLEASLNLTAPSGEKIASDIKVLKEKGKVGHVEIVSIEYLDIDKGYVAVIDYLNADNSVSNFALVKGNKYINSLGLRVSLLTKSSTESGGEGEAIAKCDMDTAKCISCVVVMNPNTTPNIYCSCENSVQGQSGGCSLHQD